MIEEKCPSLAPSRKQPRSAPGKRDQRDLGTRRVCGNQRRASPTAARWPGKAAEALSLPGPSRWPQPGDIPYGPRLRAGARSAARGLSSARETSETVILATEEPVASSSGAHSWIKNVSGKAAGKDPEGEREPRHPHCIPTVPTSDPGTEAFPNSRLDSEAELVLEAPSWLSELWSLGTNLG